MASITQRILTAPAYAHCENQVSSSATSSSSSSSSSSLRVKSLSFKNFQLAGENGRFSSRSLTRPTSGRKESHCAIAVASMAGMMGADPEWNDSDYIVLGLAHCFSKDEAAKLQDEFVIEPIGAGALECMDNGGVTCYKVVTATTHGVALAQDKSLLPAEFQTGKFCEDFDFRTKCAGRTWKREHAEETVKALLPLGSVRSDFNFNLEDKRVLNMVFEVKDSDNIKQDLSIDVYGRAEEEEAGAEGDKEIQKLYNA